MPFLKLAERQDAGKVGRFFHDLHKASVYAEVMDYKEDDVSNLVSSLADNPNTGCTIMLMDQDDVVGAIICSSMTQIFNRSEKTAVELGFWIRPEDRTLPNLKKLIGAYRYWAKQTGCTSILYGKLKSDNSPESYSLRKLT